MKYTEMVGYRKMMITYRIKRVMTFIAILATIYFIWSFADVNLNNGINGGNIHPWNLFNIFC